MSRNRSRYETEAHAFRRWVVSRSKLFLTWSLKPNTGTSYPTLDDDDILNFPIPLLPEDKQTEIQQKVVESFNLRNHAKALLEYAKRAVEIAIEQDEQTAIDWLASVSQVPDA